MMTTEHDVIFEVDDVTADTVINALENTYTRENLRNIDILQQLVAYSKQEDSKDTSFLLLLSYFDLVHSHVGFKEGLTGNPFTLSQKLEQLQMLANRTDPTNDVLKKVVASLNGTMSIRLASHDFLPNDQRSPEYWQISLPQEEQTQK